jgi:hypothetical protein
MAHGRHSPLASESGAHTVYLFVLGKAARYHYDADAIREDCAWEQWCNQTVVKRAGGKQRPGSKSTKKPRTESLRKMASLIEEHMTEKGMSEEEKNERVARFARRVDARVAKS